jgi:adenine-specific DNA-methyltransferase
VEKYLGNKTVLLPLIEQFLLERLPEMASISDLFAGTTNVSRHFRRLGMAVATGDLNRFSYVLGRAYLGNSEWPNFEGVPGEFEAASVEALRFAAERAYGNAARSDQWRAIAPLAQAIAILQHAGATNRAEGIFHSFFCSKGAHSSFVSVRGGKGRRNYFSEKNALFLDGALERLRDWREDGAISEQELFLLLSCIIEEVVITANVSGTFHDFSRTKLWPNALQSFRLRLPPAVISHAAAEVVNGDAMSAAGAVARHDVCYIDPPYNFRQYGAYYHLLNFVAAYPFLEDPKEYARDLSFVRGQNMVDDHTSSFCFRDEFIRALRDLIQRVPAPNVVLSYYGGRNHWNHWSATQEPTDRGLRELEALFRDRTVFDECEIVPVLSVRQNYQSRVGERKRFVDEYLLLGRRSEVPPARTSPIEPLSANVAVGVGEHFGHFVSGGEEPRPDIAVTAKIAMTVG